MWWQGGGIYRGAKKMYTHFKKGKNLYQNCNTQYIPTTKDEYKSRLTYAITRGAQSGYGELLLQQR
jgi:hypothetical protein